MATEPRKHVYDHKRRVHLVEGIDALSDQNLLPNEEALLKIIEELQDRVAKLEKSGGKRPTAASSKTKTTKK